MKLADKDRWSRLDRIHGMKWKDAVSLVVVAVKRLVSGVDQAGLPFSAGLRALAIH